MQYVRMFLKHIPTIYIMQLSADTHTNPFMSLIVISSMAGIIRNILHVCGEYVASNVAFRKTVIC